jgi:ferredoxin-type protein NapF
MLGGGASAVPAAGGEGFKARVSARCLALRGIVCRSCTEHCEPRAIRFRLLPAGSSEPLIAGERCDGCGECVRVCPAQALALRSPEAFA